MARRMSLESRHLSRVSPFALAGALCGLFLPVSSARAQCQPTLVVTTTADSGCGSLRDAINYANSLTGSKTITFSIPGVGVHTISPVCPLPGLQSDITIDGYSQGVSKPNTLANADNAVLLIQIDGSAIDCLGASVPPASSRSGGRGRRSSLESAQAGGPADGIVIQGSNCVVQGLVVSNFRGYGILDISDGGSPLIQGNFIGTTPNGMAAAGNDFGVETDYGTTVGGAAPASRNVISGNLFDGVQVFNSSGIIAGNFIGTNATGGGSLGNGGDGIIVLSSDNLIGGTVGGAGNVIAFNGGAGVEIACPDGCFVSGGEILGNAIFSNAGLGISLGGGASPLPNDPCDSDSVSDVANNGQNYPVLTRAEVVGSTTVIEGILNSASDLIYRVELFASPACDPSGNGEGQFFLGATTVDLVETCDGSFSLTIPQVLAAGQVVTATATDPGNDTSEFSACLAVTNSTGPCLQSPPPPHLIIDSSIVAMNSQASLTWDAPVAGFAGRYTIRFSTDNGVTFQDLAAGLANNQFTFVVQFPVGATVIFYVIADPLCGPDGVSDPSPTVTLQVVQTCPKVADPAAQLDQTGVAVGDMWSLHWTPTLPSGLGGLAGIYEIWMSRDNGVSFQVAGTTTNTSFLGGPVPQSDAGKLIFLYVVAKPSCGTGDVGAGRSNTVFFTVLPGCEGPQAARNPKISAVSINGHPVTRPPFPTEFLALSWDAPAAGPLPAAYAFRINGDPESRVNGTATIVGPRGSPNPITLFVRSVACSPEKSGPTVQSDTVTLSTTPPGADFAVSPNPIVGQAVTFTDTSSPEATGWLWVFDDGTTDSRQSPTHVFTLAGTHSAGLIATNGAGSQTKIKSFFVSAGAAATTTRQSESSALDASDPARRRATVTLGAQGSTWLHVTTGEAGDTTLFLRFLGSGGALETERRLVVSPGAEAIYDLAAWGLKGTYSLELVSDRSFSAWIVRSGRPGAREITR